MNSAWSGVEVADGEWKGWWCMGKMRRTVKLNDKWREMEEEDEFVCVWPPLLGARDSRGMHVWEW